jgi:hypothetical protein
MSETQIFQILVLMVLCSVWGGLIVAAAVLHFHRPQIGKKRRVQPTPNSPGVAPSGKRPVFSFLTLNPRLFV